MARMMSLEEAAERLWVSYTTAYRLVRRGELPAAKIGKQWRIERAKLEDWIAERYRQTQQQLADLPESLDDDQD